MSEIIDDGIQFELRKRKKTGQDFWTIYYNTTDGTILNIEPGQMLSPETLVIRYVRVKKILSGQENQNNYRIDYNEKLGALDLIDLRKPQEYKKKKQNWQIWLSQSEFSGDAFADIRATLFQENGMLRIEASRDWGQQTKENSNRLKDFEIYLSDIEDPHLVFGFNNIPTQQIIEKGFWECRLWSFMDHGLVQNILYHNQNIRLNLPPVARSVSFKRSKQYFPFSGIIDDQTLMSHPGPGQHISIFVKNNSVWAQSHYEKGSSLDTIIGNLRAGLVWRDDPDNFLGWVEFPALMLRQSHPFELISDWNDPHPPNLLYKANNIDIGVLQ